MTKRLLRTTLGVCTFLGHGKEKMRLVGQSPSSDKGTLWQVRLRECRWGSCVRMRAFIAHSTPNKRGEKMNLPAQRLLLSAILAMSAFWNLSWLTSEGYANVYYAATVKNTYTKAPCVSS